jgi:hypothetical protein
MRYITPLFLIAACATTNIHCMDLTSPRPAHPAASAGAFSEGWERAQRVRGQRVDADQKTLTLKAQFATISWLQNADEIKVTGLSTPLQSETIPTQLQQAFLAILDAPSFEFPSKESNAPIVCLDVKKLAPLFQVMKQLEQEEKQKEEQSKNDELIAQLIQKHKKANEAYRTLEHAMIFFTGDNEYWQSDLPRQNDIRLDSLKQEADRARAELEKCDQTHKRYDQNFMRKWELALNT